MEFSKNLIARVITSIVLLFLIALAFSLGKLAVYFLIMSVALLACKELLDITQNKIVYMLLVIVMVIAPYSSLIYLYSTSLNVLIWLMLCIWTTDIAAYFVGRKIGGKKICVRISPNKTWSGLFGAILMSGVFGLVFAYVLYLPYYFLFLGVFVAIVAQIGDFFESIVKRLHKVSDSGNILPGHGGILDRMDGITFAAPLLAILLSKIGM